MIPFEPVPEPEAFRAEAREPGATWLASNPDANRPRDYWSAFKSNLADGFRQLCGYSAMYEPVGTVDHFVSWKEDRTKAYEWANYRFASGWLNSSKKSLPSENILDPFEVSEGWFEILLPSLQLVTTECVPQAARRRAELTLDRLHLRHDERILRQRREWYRMYRAGELTLDGLAKKAPLVAAAIRKQAQSNEPQESA